MQGHHCVVCHFCWKWNRVGRRATNHRQRSRTVVRPMQKSIGKWKIRPPCKIVTPENIILKICTRNYVGEMTHHTNFGFNRFSGGFSLNRRNVTTLWLFLTVMSILSCPYLFFSILRPGRTPGPIFTLSGSNDVFLRKDGPFGVRTMGDHIWGNMPPPQKKGRE